MYMKIKYCCPLCKNILSECAAKYFCIACDKEYIISDEIPDLRINSEALECSFYEEVFHDHHYRFIKSENCYFRDQDYLADKIGFFIRKNALLSFLKIVNDCCSTDLVVLDLGAGDGLFSQFIIDNDSEIHCVDLSRHSLNKAAKFLNYPNLKKNKKKYFTQADISDLPFQDRSFDYVMLIEIIEHLENPIEALKEVFRVLKPNGSLFLTTPNDHGKGFLYGKFKNITSRFGFRLKEFRNIYKESEEIEQKYKIKSHIKQFTIDELKEIVFKSGFQLNTISSLYLTYLDIQMVSKLFRGVDKFINHYKIIKSLTFLEEKLSSLKYFRKKGFIQICIATRPNEYKM